MYKVTGVFFLAMVCCQLLVLNHHILPSFLYSCHVLDRGLMTSEAGEQQSSPDTVSDLGAHCDPHRHAAFQNNFQWDPGTLSHSENRNSGAQLVGT